MANLRVEIYPDDKSEVTRLGHRNIEARVHTWKTFVNTSLNKDGSGRVCVKRTRNGKSEEKCIWLESEDKPIGVLTFK